MQPDLRRRGRAASAIAIAIAAAVLAGPQREAAALIMGGEGNKPIRDPGWPKGAAAIFNSPARVAWWEGPPLGGGEWHAECRGDADEFNAVLVDFAKLDVKTKRIVVHDGAGRSFWLNPNGEPGKQVDARIDWSFTVWQTASWERLRTLPTDLNPTDPRDEAGQGPPAQLDVYTGGILRWSDVRVPAGLEVDDHRLEAHGFTPADGVVLEGKVVDLATRKPIAARVRLQRVEPQKKGGYLYPDRLEAVADAQGRWVIKKAPGGWLRIVVEADGFVPRVVGYLQHDGQPRWSSHDSGLARPGPVSGRITDAAGRPLADVDVRLGDVAAEGGGRYELPQEPTFKTGADGRFRADMVPAGRATVWVHKPGYCRPGLGRPIATPAADVDLEMMKSARVRVTVAFPKAPRAGGYIVRIVPDGGEAVGKWSGSGNIDDKNQVAFENIPPARYFLSGHPNPSSAGQETEPVAVDLKGGETTELTIKAR